MSPAERSIDIVNIDRGRYSSSHSAKVSARKDSHPREVRGEIVQGANRFVRTPDRDEFQKSTKNSCINANDCRSPKKHRTTKASDSSIKDMTPEQRRIYREKRRRERRLRVLRNKCIAIGAAGILGATAFVAGRGAISANKIEDTVVESNKTTYDNLENYEEPENYYKQGDTEFIYDADNNTAYIDKEDEIDKKYVIDEEDEVSSVSPTAEADIKQIQIDEVNQILEKNPDIKAAFNDLEIALRRASIEYGSNVIDLLEEMNEKFGMDKLPIELQACILEQENSGFFTDWKTHEVIVNGDGDTGWYQLTDTAAEDFDRVASFLIKKGVSKGYIAEIKELGRNDMRGNAGHGAIVLSYLYDKYDGDIDKTLSAYNAGEGFVARGNKVDRYIKECYKEHLEPLSRYEVLWDYILDRDYYEDEEDGVPHVYVNDSDGSVRYPD